MTTITENLTTKIRNNPEYFYESILGCSIWEKQREITYSVFNNRKTTVKSANSTGKTFIAARVALAFLYAYPPAVVIDTAPTHRQVENQFWREFRRAHKSAKKNLGGKLLKTQFNIDENWFAIGFSSNTGEDGMEAFQGWHAEHILVIIDEASGVHPRVFEAIQGAMAGGKVVRLLYIGNPTRNTGDFADSFKDPTFNHITISAFDVPNVKENRLVITGLATSEWVEDMKRKYGEDSDVYRVRVKGEFPKRDSDVLITLDLVEDATGAEREVYGVKEIIGLDPSRKGKDEAAFIYRKGNKAKIIEVIPTCTTMELAGKAKLYLKKYPGAVLHIDIDGLGAGVYDRLKEQPEISTRVFGVNGQGEPRDKERYHNTRIESWDMVREWLRDAILDDNSDYKSYWYELCSPRFKTRSNGQLLLESKDDMRIRGVKSPNVGDALALTFAQPSEGSEFVYALI
jgi:hypothetical protein